MAINRPETACTTAGRASWTASAFVGGARPAVLRHRLSVLAARAVIAEAQGEPDRATALYTKAADGWQAYGHVLEHGHALLGLGRCRLALGRPDTE